MPHVSHRLDYCLLPKLKWKIVPPPAVIPPKPTRIIRFPNYRQQTNFFPTPKVVVAICLTSSVIAGQLVFHGYVKERRER